MTFDFLVYDLDGTLVDSLGDICSSLNSVRKDNGLSLLPVDEIRSYLGKGINSLMSRAVPASIDVKRAVNEFNSYYKHRLLDTTVIFSGIKEMLESLKDKKKAVLTNKNEVYAKKIIGELGIDSFFVDIWGGDTLDVRKPDPKTIFELVKSTNSELSRTVMIGDSASDFLVAKAAGITSIAVSYGYCDIEQIKSYEPDFIVKSPQEIVTIVSRN
ncbi:MAG: HAD-IA family hydrolase [Endomicrobium sp.]|jgi:phosphoglycolate phosphatase|nr:HAD-IA family hydrolase [Endomicrobium sp.]